MKIAIALLFVIITTHPGDIESVRRAYQSASSDEDLCVATLKELAGRKDEPVFLAYHGAFQAIMASHLRNPLTKLSYFKKGKKDIEKAVRQDENNIEIRFIRLSVQKNAPSFLGYNDNIKTDTEFLKKNLASVTAPTLRTMITAVVAP